MASPKTVGQFYVETTRQSARTSASAQDAIAKYVDESASIGRVYFSAWSSAQQLSLQTAFQLQNSAIEAAQSLWEASARANLSLYEEWARAVAEGQSAVTRLVAAGVSIADGAAPGRPS